MEQATKEKIKKQLPAFIVGLVVGVAGALVVPELMIDHFEGTVTGKKRLRDRLMVMINMPKHGEVIATFTEKIGQIDFLIRPGDTVELGLAKYEVLVDNPPLAGVKRKDGGKIVGDETSMSIEPASAESMMGGAADGAEIPVAPLTDTPAAGELEDAAAEPATTPGGDA